MSQGTQKEPDLVEVVNTLFEEYQKKHSEHELSDDTYSTKCAALEAVLAAGAVPGAKLDLILTTLEQDAFKEQALGFTGRMPNHLPLAAISTFLSIKEKMGLV